jgi:hypothetical protein
MLLRKFVKHFHVGTLILTLALPRLVTAGLVSMRPPFNTTSIAKARVTIPATRNPVEAIASSARHLLGARPLVFISTVLHGMFQYLMEFRSLLFSCKRF